MPNPTHADLLTRPLGGIKRCLLVASLVAATGAAWANTPVSHFTKAQAGGVVLDPAQGYAQVQPWAAPGMTAGASPGEGPASTLASASFGGVHGHRSVYGAAEADLSMGTLRAYAATQGMEAGAGSTQPGMRATALGTASFGDSFVFGNTNGNGPFSWQPGQRAGFSFVVDGFSSNSLAQPGSFADNSWARAGWQLSVNVFQPDEWGSSIGGLFVSLDKVATNVIRPIEVYSSSSFDVSVTLNEFSQWVVTASFAPGGNFNWSVDFSASASVGTDDTVASAAYDHTVRMGFFSNVEELVVGSGSGAFPGTVQAASIVPEPGAWALFTLGLLGIAARTTRLRLTKSH